MKDGNIIVITHGHFGEEMIKSAEMIIGEIDNIKALSLTPDLSLEDLINKIKTEVAGIEDDVILLTDLFGGTPNNVASYFKQAMNIPVVTGLNLAMLISVIMNRDNHLADGISQVDFEVNVLSDVVTEAQNAIRIV